MGFMFPVKRNTGMLTNMPSPWRSKAAEEIMHFLARTVQYMEIEAIQNVNAAI